MSNSKTERDLLFGILALQNNFIDRRAFLSAFDGWVLDKSHSLGQRLVDDQQISSKEHDLLAALVEQHLLRHAGNAQESLAAINSGVIRGGIDAAVWQNILSIINSGEPAADPNRTLDHALGAGTPAGQRFRILRPHAKGGLGLVSVAHDEELSREVALKEIQSRHAHDPQSRFRFLLEAEITGRLEHPGIVPVYGLGSYEDGRPFYAMRFIRGESLQDAIQRFHGNGVHGPAPSAERGLELRKLLARFVGVCNAVEYAHSRGVLHRDLKPANIMLGKYGEVLVVDWGLARVMGASDQVNEAGESMIVPSRASGSHPSLAGSAVGTPAFMSPEQAAGRLECLGPATDVYGLGATLYMLLTGQPPLMATSANEVLSRVEKGDWPHPRQVKPDIPRGLEAICLKAMSLKPEDRYGSPRTLANDLEHWLADEPVSAHPDAVSARVARWARRHRRGVQAGALALVAVSLVSITAALLVDQARREADSQRDIARGALAAEQGALRAERQAKTELATSLEAETAARKKARLAVDNYVKRINDVELLKDERFQPLRQNLLQDALQYYQELIREQRQDSANRFETSKAILLAASITAVTAPTVDGTKAMHEAIATLRGLSEHEPADSSYKFNLGLGLQWLGARQSNAGDFDGGVASYRQAEEAFRQLFESQPYEAEYEISLATTLRDLGLQLQAAGKFTEARRCLEEEFEISRDLVARFPEQRTFQTALGQSYSRLASVHAKLGNVAAQAECHHRALGTRRRLFEAQHRRLSNDLAQSYRELAVFDGANGRPNEAEFSLMKAALIQRVSLDSQPNSTYHQSELAGYYHTLARLLMSRGSNSQSIPVFDQAIAMRRKLVQREPTVATHRSNLADSLSGLASALYVIGEVERGRLSYEEAVTLRKALCESHPHVLEYRAALANLHQIFGISLIGVGAWNEAPATFQAAQATYEQMARDYPTVISYQSDFATTLVTVAATHKKLGRVEDALASVERAVELRKRLVDEQPSVTYYHSMLAAAYGNLSQLQRDMGDPLAALANSDRAMAVVERLRQSNPRDPALRALSAQIAVTLGDLHLTLGDLAKAFASYDRSAKEFSALSEAEPANIAFRSQWAFAASHRAGLLVRTGQMAGAIADCELALRLRRELVERAPAVAEHRSNLADSHNSLGRLLQIANRTDEALAQFESAVALRQALATGSPHVARYQRDLATAFLELGHLLRAMGQGAKTLVAFRQALSINQSLADQHPADDSHRAALASNHDALGHVLREAGKLDAALVPCQQALEMRESLLQQHPASLQYQIDLANSYNMVGIIQYELKRYEEALTSYHLALDLRDSLVRSRPDEAGYRVELGHSHYNIGLTFGTLKRFDQAVDSQRQAITVRKTLLDQDPGSAKFQSDLAISLFRLGEYEDDRKQYPAALDAFEQALDLRKQIAASQPGVLQSQANLGEAYRAYANALSLVDRQAESQTARQQAMDLLRKVIDAAPDNRSFQRELGRCYRDIARIHRAAGDLEASAAAVLERRRIFHDDPTELYACARQLSLCVESLDALKRTPAQDAQREKYIQLAVDTLRLAVAAGYETTGNWQTSANMKALRETAPYKALLVEIRDRTQKP